MINERDMWKWRAVDLGLKWGVWAVNSRGHCLQTIADSLDKPTALKIAAVNEMEAALDDICTQYPLIHGEPVPAWIRNGCAALSKARGKGHE